MSDTARSDERVHTTCLVILALIASGAALAHLRPVVVPFLISLMLVYAIGPVIDWQRNRLGWPRGIAVIGAGLAAIVLLTIAGLLLAAFVVKLREHLPIFHEQLQSMTERIKATVDLKKLGLESGISILQIPESASRQLLGAVLAAAADMVSDGVLVVLFVLFMVIGGATAARQPTGFRAEVNAAVRAYITNMIGLSVLTGVLVGGVLAVLGVSFALEFGVIAFLLNFIPNIGSMIATILPIPVILLSPELGTSSKILAIALPAIIQTVLGSVVAPRVMGKAQDLHPVTVLLAMVFFGTIWGIMGAVLAVPITSVLRLVFARTPATQPIAAWLAGDFDEPTPIHAESAGS